MAEGLFGEYLKAENIKGIEASSAGIFCRDGGSVTENAVYAAEILGADIKNHKTKALKVDDFTPETYFICMTSSISEIISAFNPEAKVMALEIGDPFGCDGDVYLKTAKEIRSNFHRILLFVRDGILISPMEKGDIPYIAELERENFSLAWSEKSFQEELENLNARFYTAKLGDKLVGYIGAFNVCGEVSISNIAVKESFRNRGIGGGLLRQIEETSKFEQAEFITLEVRESNGSARRLYEKNGYREVGLRKGFYQKPKEDAVLMTKFLNEDGRKDKNKAQFS